MPNVTKLQEYGNSIKVIYDDGTTDLALPTMGGLWVVSGTEGGTPSGSWIWPFPLTTVVSEFGPRTGVGAGTFHEGIDFAGGAASSGADIPCASEGTVQLAGSHVNFGNYVIVHHGTVGAYDLKTLYAHMNATPLVSTGATVTKGQTLGYVGETGDATGPHLHFETHKCSVGGSIIWNVTDNSNPRTAVDPRDFMAEYA